MTSEKPRTTREIATRLAELCQKGDYETALSELYDESAVSIEPEKYAAQGPRVVEGLPAMKQKLAGFLSQLEEFHSGYVSEPQVAGNFISLAIGMDISLKGPGRIQLEEIAVYEVKNGKIVKEQFFF